MEVNNLVGLLLGLCVCGAFSHNVLFFHNMGTRSHLLQMAPLVQELLDRGHRVTGVFFGSMKIEHANYDEIVVPDNFKELQKVASEKFMEEGGHSPLDPRLLLWSINLWRSSMKDMAVGYFKEEKFTKLLESDQKFDAVVTVFPMGAFLADHFDCPIINFSPVGPASFFLYGTGNVINPSVQPTISAPFIEPMGFGQRIGNHFLIRAADAVMVWMGRSVANYQRELLGPDIRNPYEILNDRSSVYLSCSHYVTHGSWPYLPNVIEVGGLHLDKPKDLPEDLKDFMDSSPGGVAFVSFGSSFSPSKMSQERLDMFLEAFSKLEISIIWKWDGEVPNIPENVRISSWLPQQDLLGHPNLKVFVTHGGLGSLVESIYHKAVIVGIPFSNDQRPNLLRAQKNGYAKIVEWETLTSKDLYNGIKDAMSDETMRASMEKVHNLYMDREEPPLKKATWWVEYVCRNKGAEMLKSGGAEDIPWYQYHHVDIAIFLGMVILCMIGGVVLSCKFCCKLCCAKKVKSE